MCVCVCVCVCDNLQGIVKSRWNPPPSSFSYTYEKTHGVCGVPQLSVGNGKLEEGRCPPPNDSVQNKLRKKLAHHVEDDHSNEIPETRREREEWETTPSQPRPGRRRRHFSAKKQRKKAKKRQRKATRKYRHSKQVLHEFHCLLFTCKSHSQPCFGN